MAEICGFPRFLTRRPSRGLEKSVKFPDPTCKRGDGGPQSEVRPLPKSRSVQQPKQGGECPVFRLTAAVQARIGPRPLASATRTFPEVRNTLVFDLAGPAPIPTGPKISLNQGGLSGTWRGASPTTPAHIPRPNGRFAEPTRTNALVAIIVGAVLAKDAFVSNSPMFSIG